MDTRMNPTKSTDKNRTLHGEDTGEIRIALDQRPAGHRRFPQPPGPPPNRPLPNRPTPWAKTTPEYAQGRTSQAQTIQEDSQDLVREDLVRKVLATAFFRVEGDAKTLTNLNHSGSKGELDEKTGQPYKAAVEALLKAMKEYELEEEEENKLLTHMQWKFLCEKCEKPKPAEEFSSCSRKFWKNKLKKDVLLHGDECYTCDEEALREEFRKLNDQYQSS